VAKMEKPCRCPCHARQALDIPNKSQYLAIYLTIGLR
jgi:hypothetical protein